MGLLTVELFLLDQVLPRAECLRPAACDDGDTKFGIAIEPTKDKLSLPM
jgi:hypothetical protein